MKKLIILILVILTISGCSKQSASTSNNSNESTPTNDIAETMEVNVSFDFVATTPEQLNDDDCSLIIVGTLQNVNNNFVRDQLVYENANIKIDKILKGDYKKGTVKVNYVGGQVTYEEYINAVGNPPAKTPNAASEYAAKMTNPPEYKYVKMAETKESVKAKKDQQYLFFLGKNDDGDDENYIVMADAYGVRPIKDGKAFNPDTEQYETISFLNLN